MRLLTETSTVDGRRVRTVRWHGKDVRVRDDADTALRIVDLFADETKNPRGKLAEAIGMLFLDPESLSEVEDFTGLLASVCWDEVRLDIDGSHRDEINGRRVLDWDADADYIQASLLACYGVSWDEVRYSYSYQQLTSMLGLVDRDTPLGQALYYRTANPPKPTKYNADEIKAWRERQAFWEIKSKNPEDRYKAMSDSTASFFANLQKRGE